MDVAEELTQFEPQIDKAHVEKRVLNWVARIQTLYVELAAWLPAGWSAVQSGSVSMNEPLMRDYGVPARELPMLTLLQGACPEGELTPRDLWIIGANGRIDLVRRLERYVIVDVAENFEPPLWKVAPFFRRREQQDLTSSSLRAILI